jgi:uncharacterized protein YdhG (YjbR/CyaY superfamily)
MAAPNVDAYIEGLAPATQEVVQQLRAIIASVLPSTATEKISYAIPAFAVDGTVVIFFAGWAKHVSIYPAPVGSAAFQRRIAPYVNGKGTVSFPLSKPLPEQLVREITKVRFAEHGASRQQ